tara:strand:- start:1333 stop:1611 length:279 start_codon:yes stop_codon:yes gene_type:complete
MSNFVEKQIVWAKSRKQSESSKFTTWASSKDYCKLGGFSVKADDFSKFVSVSAHNSDGESWNRYFQIPVDKIEDFCDALIKAKSLIESNNEK